MDEEKIKRMQERQKLRREESYQRHLVKQKSSVDYRKREFLDEIRASNRSGSHVNCLRLFKNNTIEHEQTKFLVCWTLLKWGHEFITEPIFNNGKRADVIDLNTGIIYEVIKSETEEKLADKVESYPGVFEVRKVNANEPFKEELLL